MRSKCFKKESSCAFKWFSGNNKKREYPLNFKLEQSSKEEALDKIKFKFDYI